MNDASGHIVGRFSQKGKAVSLFAARNSWAHRLGDWGTALLRVLPAETAHDVGLWAMERGLMDHLPRPAFPAMVPELAITVPGIGRLPHPVGLAAGFDKDARAPEAFRRMGLSFLEVGTVTPEPQAGNAKPRLFRLAEQKAVINRMGFNGKGAENMARRLEALRWDHDATPLGVNVGKNKLTPEEHALEDYVKGLARCEGLARYYVVNVSSPNTEGLRRLASVEFIEALAQAVPGLLPKLWVKLDPDMPREAFQRLVAAIQKSGFQGLVLTNTHRVAWPQAGGLSGAPLGVMASTRLEWAWEVHGGKLLMIASGGVMTGLDAYEKMARGASAVQIYSALVYRGPWAVAKILEELWAEMRLRGMAAVTDVVASHYRS